MIDHIFKLKAFLLAKASPVIINLITKILIFNKRLLFGEDT